MKKIFLVLALIAFATPALAAEDITSDEGTTLGGGVFKPSTNVIVSVGSSPTAYAAGAKHKLGTKGYASTNADPKIVELDCSAGQTKVTVSSPTGTNEATMPSECSGT